MTPNEYLDAVKTAVGAATDYQLAKALRIPRNTLSAIRHRDRKIDLETAYRIAVTIQQDPSAVIADLEAQRTKNATRKAFFESFTSRASSLAVLACTLALIYSGGLEKGSIVNGGNDLRVISAVQGAYLWTRGIAHNVYYVK